MRIVKQVISVVLMSALLPLGIFAQEPQVKKPTFQEIYDNYSFIDTAELSETVSYSKKELETELKRLQGLERQEIKTAREEQKKAESELKKAQIELKKISDQLSKLERKYQTEKTIVVNGKARKERSLDQEALANDPQYQSLQEARRKIRCQIHGWEVKSNEQIYNIKLESIHTYYEVLGTQIDLLQKWSIEYQKAQQEIESGQADNRPFAHPENIGSRDLGVGNQQEDLQFLQYPEVQDIIKEVQKHEYKNEAVRSYVVGLVNSIVKHSDLKYPIDEKNIFILNDEDINAFTIGGGILGVNTGLLTSAKNEAELVGVLSHEIGHLSPRHTYRLMKKANTAGLIFQIAQIAGLILTGGALTMLTYYLMQAGYTALGLILNLKLLGVSREFEIEADTLGMQYLWKMGYDPMSFLNFFERMGRDKGYLRHTSFFRTHPAFAERIVSAFKEFQLLPAAQNQDYIVNTDEFMMAKARICVDREIKAEEEKQKKNKEYKPSLGRKKEKEDAELDEECGIEKPQIKKNDACSDPELQPYKERVRQEIEVKKDEKDKIELKRPPACCGYVYPY